MQQQPWLLHGASRSEHGIASQEATSRLSHAAGFQTTITNNKPSPADWGTALPPDNPGPAIFAPSALSIKDGRNVRVEDAEVQGRQGPGEEWEGGGVVYKA